MSVLINDKTFPAEYMTTPEQLMRGMMGRDSLDGCMVFKMGMGHHTFHMQQTKLPLDIVFINKSRISRIHPNCQPNCREKFTGIGDHVVEFPAGATDGWKVGDKTNLYLGTPENPVR